MDLSTLITDARLYVEAQLAEVNDLAKQQRRRGFSGVYGEDYRKIHVRLNDLLDDWQLAPQITLGTD